jgi:hypothetical protein
MKRSLTLGPRSFQNIATSRHSPVVRAVIRLRLPIRYGSVSTPEPTMEFGGLEPLPPGTVVVLDIGPARGCPEATAWKIAGALRLCAEVQVTGRDWQGVVDTRAQLAAALTAAGVDAAC